MMKRFLLLLTIASVFVGCGGTNDEKAAASLARRVLGGKAGRITFVQTADTLDVFELQQVGTRVVIRGNNANSMAMGLGWYLRYICHKDLSWYACYGWPKLDHLPVVPKEVRIEARVDERFFLNYCTYGYTMPYWHWDDWEHFIDWMALQGVTMPLAITGQEAVWERVWKKYGMTEEEIRSYFTGPAHLPWHRMNNIDAWQGPLPQNWLDGQVELQQKIVARERELGMRPVLPAFSGHVPARLKELYPDAPVSPVSPWCGFSKPYNCWYLDPSSELFSQIQKDFIEEQTRLFGTDHIYGVDPFNEVDAPSWEPDFLASQSAHLYQSLAAADPDAVWLQMAWFIINKPEEWTAERTKAFLTGVPQGKMILLDYACEALEGWKVHPSFYGQPYITCFLGNFGGNTILAGDYRRLDDRLEDVLRNGSTLFGLGATLEGFGLNQHLYEFTLDKAWSLPFDLDGWVDRLAWRMTGNNSEKSRVAVRSLVYDLMPKSMIPDGFEYGGTIPLYHPSLGRWRWTTNVAPQHDTQGAMAVWKALLDVVGRGDSYNNIVVFTGLQALGFLFEDLRDAYAADVAARDLEGMQDKSARLLDLLREMEELAACSPELRLDRFVGDARAWGRTPEESTYYEWNARSIVTVWGETWQLNDYATRAWSGLLGDFFLNRWRIFFEEVQAQVAAGKTFEQTQAVDARIFDFERRWVLPQEAPVSCAVAADPWETAARLYLKYEKM